MKEKTKYEAIYVRQSVNRLDSISIESQTEQCKKEVISDDYRVYADRGYSGKNTERPEFQRLIGDIKTGRVSRVIVYKLDRISRSVLDFAEMIDTFKRHRVDFVSTAEKFDTGTPVGNAMLMLVMIFAQLERETIQQRVIDAYAARSRRGFYMGGPVPYGFRLKDTVIDGINTKMYVPDEKTVHIVKTIFDLYSEPHNSLGDVVRFLENAGISNNRGNPFSGNRVREMIINPIYVRADGSIYDFYKSHGTNISSTREEFNGINGAYLYSGDTEKRKCLNLNGHTLVIAPHEGIIDPETWLKCREKCLDNKSSAKACKAKATWLAGKIKCGRCGYALAAKTCVRKTVADKRYFICTKRAQALKCDLGAIDADAVEEAVLREMRKKLSEFTVLTLPDTAFADPATEKKKAMIETIETEINEYLEKVPGSNAVLMKYINEKVDLLDKEKAKLIRELDELESKSDPVQFDHISGYMDHWERLSTSDKITVVDALIESIHATKEKIEIRWKI